MNEDTMDIIEASSGGDVSVSKDYLDKQFALLAQFNLKPTSAEKYYVVVNKDGTKILRKREKPIQIFDIDDIGRATCVRNVQKTYSERIGLDADHTGKGKYHDAHKLALLEAQESGLEVGEVDAWD